ncbi:MULTISPECIES: hypothetical protein [Pseudomonas]|uniref:Uncharacterized protein n=2 Tax=Pseudomonas TaxID=286 RepID=A0A9Q6IIN5_9PSED|nr:MULTISPECIES: hypothetical protein [Pseudomonas]MBW8354606.1 hypothetical protein [Pseudomonas sp.]MCO7575906.1 hypothetical protein [Pseudomonas protegens]MCO7581256.1 hypothetical protein [Pseudomonas chlororaphis]MCO7597719.1 hypothetical protein [Pseudomonas chlororaphis]MCY7259183.1 hypothetical protein [Pseudomonas protegens]
MCNAKDIYTAGWILVVMSGLVSLVIQVYLGYFKIDDMVKYLARCRVIAIRMPLLGKDPLSRLCMLVCIGGMFAMPHLFLRNGGMDVRDYKNFPLGLKWLINLFQLSALAAVIAFLVLWWVSRHL